MAAGLYLRSFMEPTTAWHYKRLPRAVSSKVRKPPFEQLARIAADTGHEIYVVGGYVRDLFMGRPSGDIDILVIGSGVGFAREVARRVPEVRDPAYFKNFGTAQLRWHRFEIEFVGARRESYQRHSRKPVVEEGSLEDDLWRRDFTINTLAVWLGPAQQFRLVDPFLGLEHLRAGLIETPQEPKTTFSDDPLRMMRAIRFATQLGFRLSERVYDAILAQASRLDIISMERVADELNKIMLSPRPSVGFKLLDELELLPKIMPELCKMKGVETIDDQSHKDNFYHTLQVLDNVAEETDKLWLRWAALLHDIGKPRTKRFDPEQGWTFHGHEIVGQRIVPELFKRLKLPLNDKMRYVRKMVGLHHRPIALTHQVSDSAIRRLLVDAGDELEDLFILCRADITSKNPKRKERYLHNFDQVMAKIEAVEARDRLRNWKPPVDGEQIMQLFNLKPSREVGTIKNAMREAILNGDIPNEPEAALHYVRHKGEEEGLKVDEPTWQTLQSKLPLNPKTTS